MDYEKKYKEALERAKSFELPEYKNIMVSIFPELRESEEERIRKALIQGFNECLDSSSHYPKNAQKYWHGIAIEDILAWLDKPQKTLSEMLEEYFANTPKEQIDKNWEELKHLNNIGPIIETVNKSKFHKDDWIVNNDSGGVYQVTEIKDDEYCLWPLDAEIMGYLRIIDVDNDYHLWTIQDAKSGDILSSKDKSNILSHTTTPAIKEQRDLLFKKMKDAGYEWDAEKKELRKIEKQGEHKPTLRERYENIVQSEWFKRTHDGMSCGMITPEESLGISSEKYNEIVDECIFGDDKKPQVDGFDAELKEIDDEKMKNWIINELELSYQWAAGDRDRCEELLKAIAWLEKLKNIYYYGIDARR